MWKPSLAFRWIEWQEQNNRRACQELPASMPSLGMEDIDRNADLYIEMDNLNVKNHK
jgi:hypothetical protein